jgi:hypothetical protein
VVLTPRLPESVAKLPTGIPSCDAYLSRVEMCSQRMLAKTGSPSDAMQRITLSLDMTRRAWRNADLTAKGRAQLAETCSDSIRLYNMSASNACD